MSETFEVWFETVDFKRDVYLYVTVDGTGFLHPEGDSFVVSPEKKPFMQFNPAILDLKDLILTIYNAIIRDEERPAIDAKYTAAFREELNGIERSSRRPG